jgi:hypothetical protein
VFEKGSPVPQLYYLAAGKVKSVAAEACVLVSGGRGGKLVTVALPAARENEKLLLSEGLESILHPVVPTSFAFESTGPIKFKIPPVSTSII